MRDGVGKQTCAAAVWADSNDLGRPGGGDGVGGELDDTDEGGLRAAELAGHVLELLGDGLGEVVRFGLVGVGEEDVDVGSVGCGDWRKELAGDDGAGEAGLGPVKDELCLAARCGVLTGDAAADDVLAGGNGDVNLSGKAVGVKARERDGEPTARIEKDAYRIGDVDEVDDVNRTGVDGGRAAVGEGPGGICALG